MKKPIVKNAPLCAIGVACLVISTFLTDLSSYAGDNAVITFVLSSLPWVLMGVGVALVCASTATKKKK